MVFSSDALPFGEQFLAWAHFLLRAGREIGGLGRLASALSKSRQLGLDLSTAFREEGHESRVHAEQFKGAAFRRERRPNSLSSSAPVPSGTEPRQPSDGDRVPSVRVFRGAIGAHPDVEQECVNVKLRVLRPTGRVQERGEHQFGRFVNAAIFAPAADAADGLKIGHPAATAERTQASICARVEESAWLQATETDFGTDQVKSQPPAVPHRRCARACVGRQPNSPQEIAEVLSIHLARETEHRRP
jgi:hypothetical protein